LSPHAAQTAPTWRQNLRNRYSLPFGQPMQRTPCGVHRAPKMSPAVMCRKRPCIAAPVAGRRYRARSAPRREPLRSGLALRRTGAVQRPENPRMEASWPRPIFRSRPGGPSARSRYRNKLAGQPVQGRPLHRKPVLAAPARQPMLKPNTPRPGNRPAGPKMFIVQTRTPPLPTSSPRQARHPSPRCWIPGSLAKNCAK